MGFICIKNGKSGWARWEKLYHLIGNSLRIFNSKEKERKKKESNKADITSIFIIQQERRCSWLQCIGEKKEKRGEKPKVINPLINVRDGEFFCFVLFLWDRECVWWDLKNIFMTMIPGIIIFWPHEMCQFFNWLDN